MLKKIKVFDELYCFNGDNLSINKIQDFLSYSFDKSKKFSDIVLKTDLEKLKNKIENGIKKYRIEITQDCNMKCKYCIYGDSYSYTRENTKNYMTTETIEFIVEFIKKRSKSIDRIIIGFYGGESFLAFNLIRKFVNLIRTKLSHEIKYQITTNGTLLTRKNITFLIKNNFELAISLDGPKWIQDSNRVFKNNQGSYDIIVNNLKYIYNTYPNYLSKLTLLSVCDDFTKLDVLYDFFEKEPIVKNFKFDISFVVSRRLKENEILVMQENYENLLKNINERSVDEIKENIFFRINRSHLRHIFLRKKLEQPSSKESIYLNGICKPLADNIFFTYSGKIKICEKLDMLYKDFGNVSDGIKINKVYELINEYKNISESCKSCWLGRICSKCFIGAIDKNTLSQKKKEDECRSTRKLFEQLLVVYIMLTKNKINLNDILQ